MKQVIAWPKDDSCPSRGNLSNTNPDTAEISCFSPALIMALSSHEICMLHSIFGMIRVKETNQTILQVMNSMVLTHRVQGRSEVSCKPCLAHFLSFDISRRQRVCTYLSAELRRLSTIWEGLVYGTLCDHHHHVWWAGFMSRCDLPKKGMKNVVLCRFSRLSSRRNSAER